MCQFCFSRLLIKLCLAHWLFLEQGGTWWQYRTHKWYAIRKSLRTTGLMNKKFWRGQQWMLAVSGRRKCLQQTQQKSQSRKTSKDCVPNLHIPTQQLQHTLHALFGKWEPHAVTGGCNARGQCSCGNVCPIHTAIGTSIKQWNCKWWSETGMVCRW